MGWVYSTAINKGLVGHQSLVSEKIKKLCHPVALVSAQTDDHGTQVMYSYIMSFEQKYYYVYIMASSKNGTLYIGFTSNLPQRIFEHKNHLLPGFTNKYNVDKLVYFERFEDVNHAIRHEKRLKEWKRNWKKDLIEKHNPQWRDLYDDLNNLL